MSPLLTRRDALGLSAGALAALATAPRAFAQARPRLVVIGGGFGGATAARALRRLVPAAEVTLVEPVRTYTACPFSNLVIAGLRPLSAQRLAYDALAAEGIRVVHARADDIDPQTRSVRLSDDSRLAYDRLVLSPGIDMRWGVLEGYDGAAAADRLPHAWKAGPQTALLAAQVEAMPEDGVMVITVPSAPYRCPPGPYERASLVAHVLKTRKPRAKLLILDAKDSFSKQPLFEAEWAARYPGIVEWRGASSDGTVRRVDPSSLEVFTDFEAIRADVINVIPPQQAGAIALQAGVADATGWCPVEATAFESTLQPAIHVIGDATIAAPMPKSAFAAGLQARVVAVQIARILAGREPEPTRLANTCYSFVAPDAAVSIAGVYTNTGGRLASVEGAGGLSALDGDAVSRSKEAAQAAAWFDRAASEAFG